MYYGAWYAPGAASACCTCHMCGYKWYCGALDYTWCCQCLLHLSYLLLHVCIVVLEAHKVLFMCWLMYSGVLGVHLVQEGSGPCKIPISYGVTGDICILLDMYAYTQQS